jgi:hypothetical protein
VPAAAAVINVDLLGADAGAAASEDELLDLADGGLGQLGEERASLRRLEVGEVLAGECA